mgnify:FL=1|tara:strand:+ start:7610 stop:8398 length:789 start_codon:yes stop_codon:yes gene_type:complete
MAIRKLQYSWELFGDNTNGKTSASPAGSHYPPPGVEHSIFTGSFGNIQGQTGLVSEDDFVVLDTVSSTPGISPYGFQTLVNPTTGNTDLIKWNPNMFANIVIDTTNYYQDPQNVWSSGVSGFASPYPRQTYDEPYYELWPPVYVLPDQTLDIRYTLFNDIQLSAENNNWNNIPSSTMLCAVYVTYTLFSGTDGLMARQLMNLGIPVNVGTVENYRRLLLKSKGLETDTFDFYLEAMRNERKRRRKERKQQGVATQNDYEGDL